jgi:hypothetical protein
MKQRSKQRFSLVFKSKIWSLNPAPPVWTARLSTPSVGTPPGQGTGEMNNPLAIQRAGKVPSLILSLLKTYELSLKLYVESLP